MIRAKNHEAAAPSETRAPQLRLRVLSCEIVFREICLIAANSPNIVDLEFLPKGLHDAGAETMRRTLQERLDAADPEVYDAVALGYGLCSNGTTGLVASRLPVVIPRAHDCITLFLGSKERYRAYFERHPGTFFRTTGWSERDFCRQRAAPPSRLGTDKTYEEYVRLYGQENADFIREMLSSWERHYDRLVYVDMGFANFLPYADQAEQDALEKGWSFERLNGSLALIEALLNGPWLDDQFLVLQPGEAVVAASDGRIIDRRVPAVQ